MDGLYELTNLIDKKNNEKICECGYKMNYSLLGIYRCPNCNYEEKDLYGKLRDLLDKNPSLTKLEISLILNIPLKTLNKYIQNGYLVNPRNF